MVNLLPPCQRIIDPLVIRKWSSFFPVEEVISDLKEKSILLDHAARRREANQASTEHINCQQVRIFSTNQLYAHIYAFEDIYNDPPLLTC